MSIFGWGEFYRGWLIEHKQLWGDPTKIDVWKDLEAALQVLYSHQYGAELKVAASCIDSGFHTQQVYNFVKNEQFDVVIHTATYDAAPKNSLKDPAKVLENNLRMFFNIVRCQDYFGKMIYFGSGAEFGRENWKPKMKEVYFDQHIPEDQYGFSKYIMTKYAAIIEN